MPNLRRATLVVPALSLAAQAPDPDEAMARLKDHHLASRAGDWKTFGLEQRRRIREEDRACRARAAELLRLDRLKDTHSYDHAALIFQHGDEADDALVARELSLLACFLKAVYVPMPAMAEDKYLLKVIGQQRFGCGHRVDAEGPPDLEAMAPEDAWAVTDALRLDFFVPPLALSRRHTAQQAAELGFPLALKRMQARMKSNGPAPNWVTKPDSKSFTSVLKAAKPEGLSKRRRSSLRAQVLELYRSDRLSIPADYHRAAEILLVCGETPSHFILANEFAAVAVMRQHAPAWPTFARSWDRFARSIGEASRYGTDGEPMAGTVVPAVMRQLGPLPL